LAAKADDERRSIALDIAKEVAVEVRAVVDGCRDGSRRFFSLTQFWVEVARRLRERGVRLTGKAYWGYDAVRAVVNADPALKAEVEACVERSALDLGRLAGAMAPYWKGEKAFDADAAMYVCIETGFSPEAVWKVYRTGRIPETMAAAVEGARHMKEAGGDTAQRPRERRTDASAALAEAARALGRLGRGLAGFEQRLEALERLAGRAADLERRLEELERLAGRVAALERRAGDGEALVEELAGLEERVSAVERSLDRAAGVDPELAERVAAAETNVRILLHEQKELARRLREAEQWLARLREEVSKCSKAFEALGGVAPVFRELFPPRADGRDLKLPKLSVHHDDTSPFENSHPI